MRTFRASLAAILILVIQAMALGASSVDTYITGTLNAKHFLALNDTAGTTAPVDTGSSPAIAAKTGTVTFGVASIVPNDSETAATFGGGYINTGSTCAPSASSYTFGLALKITGTGSRVIWANRDISGNGFGSESYVQADGSLVWYSGGAGGSQQITIAATAMPNIVDGSAHTLVYVYDATKAIKTLQVDGIVCARATAVPVIPTATVNVFIGVRPDTSVPFAGTIQKFAFIDGALTTKQAFAFHSALRGEPQVVASLATFDTVQYVYPLPGDQKRLGFDALFNKSKTSTVRVAVIGDSRMTAPGGGGVAAFPMFTLGLAAYAGNVPATPLTNLSHSGPNWPLSTVLSSGTVGSARIVTATGATCQIPPNVTVTGLLPVGTMGAGNGYVNKLQDDGGSFTISELQGTRNLFSTSANPTLEIVGSAATGSGEFSYTGTGTDTAGAVAFPSAGTAVATSPAGTTALGLNQTPASGRITLLSQLIPNFSSGGLRYTQAELFAGSGQADLVGTRWWNPTSTAGFLVDCYSAGGYAANTWFGSADGSTTGNHANAHDFIAQMKYDLIFIFLDTNDAYNGVTPSVFSANLYSPNNVGLFAAGHCKGLIGEIFAAYDRASLSRPRIVLVNGMHHRDDATANYPQFKSYYDQYASTMLSVAQSITYSDGSAGCMFVNAHRLTYERGCNEDTEDYLGVRNLNWKTTWTTSTAYLPGDMVKGDGAVDLNYYRCLTGHTSAAGTKPGDQTISGNWLPYWKPIRLNINNTDSPAAAEVVHQSFAGARMWMTATIDLAVGTQDSTNANLSTGIFRK